MESILNSIKKMLGIAIEDTSFDDELILHINGVLNIMNQLGVGPDTGFSITDDSQTWSDLLLLRNDLNSVKMAVFLRVRLIFDPPQNSFLVAAIEKQIQELDWRIEVQHPALLIEESGSPVGG